MSLVSFVVNGFSLDRAHPIVPRVVLDLGRATRGLKPRATYSIREVVRFTSAAWMGGRRCSRANSRTDARVTACSTDASAKSSSGPAARSPDRRQESRAGERVAGALDRVGFGFGTTHASLQPTCVSDGTCDPDGRVLEAI